MHAVHAPVPIMKLRSKAVSVSQAVCCCLARSQPRQTLSSTPPSPAATIQVPAMNRRTSPGSPTLSLHLTSSRSMSRVGHHRLHHPVAWFCSELHQLVLLYTSLYRIASQGPAGGSNSSQDVQQPWQLGWLASIWFATVDLLPSRADPRAQCRSPMQKAGKYIGSPDCLQTNSNFASLIMVHLLVPCYATS